MLIRGASGFHREALMPWCECLDNVHFPLGCGRISASWLSRCRRTRSATGSSASGSTGHEAADVHGPGVDPQDALQPAPTAPVGHHLGGPADPAP